jgi:hypothetical protein
MNRILQNFIFQVSCASDTQWKGLRRNFDGNIKARRDISQFKHDLSYLTTASREISHWASGRKATTEYQYKRGKGTPWQTRKPRWLGGRGIALKSLDFGSTTPRPLYPRERPGTHCRGGWVGPRAGLEVCEKPRPYRDSIPGPSARSQSLYRLGYPGP